MLLGYSVKCIEHDGQYHLWILLDQAHHIFVVPKIQCSLSNLEREKRWKTSMLCAEIKCYSAQCMVEGEKWLHWESNYWNDQQGEERCIRKGSKCSCKKQVCFVQKASMLGMLCARRSKVQKRRRERQGWDIKCLGNLIFTLGWVCTHLEVWAGHTLWQLLEEGPLHFRKLLRMDDVQDLFHLSQIHHLLGTVRLGPEPQQPIHNLP